MPTFKTAGGVEWVVKVDGPKALQVRRELDGLDIVARDASQFEVLTNDPLKSQQVLWILCREQAAHKGLEQEAFMGLLGGDVGRDAGVALIEAITDFFPTRQREALRQMLAANLEAEAAMQEHVATRLSQPGLAEKLAAKGIREIDQALDQLLGTPQSSATD
jgi:hypothetical protein